jgi:hypothetical protein
VSKKNTTSVDWVPSAGSSVRRPVSKDPRRHYRYIIFSYRAEQDMVKAELTQYEIELVGLRLDLGSNGFAATPMGSAYTLL